MAYIPSECTIEQYNNAIYSEDAKHKLYIKVGETILENPDDFCERLTWENYLLDEGSKTFHLDNLVSKKIELVLHDYKLEDLKQEMEIKLGTYINDTIGYVYVPLGLYKIQDNPTTDKNKTTYKLRDRSIKFDFNYNAQPIIDTSEHIDESGKQYVTKLELLKDICLQANMNYVGDEDFIGYDDPIAIFDNTVSARIYLTYIFEQSGRIAKIDRNGDLTSVVINNNLSKQILPFGLVESYVVGDKYKISKTIYESGVIKYEDGTEDYDILYINSANPYIISQEQLNRIQASINGFEIDSLKISKIIGNPAIDSYDLISITNEDSTYITLGQNKLSYNGKILQNFETNIEYEAKQSNVTKNSQETFRKFAKTEIDNVNAEIKLVTTETTTIKENLTSNYYSVEQTNELIQNAKDGLTNAFSKAGGNNYIKDSMGVLNDGSWTNISSVTDTFTRQNAIGQSAIMLQKTESTEEEDNSIRQEIQCKNGTYTISFQYLKLIELAICKILINDVEYELEEYNSLTEFNQTINVSSGKVTIEFISDTNEVCYIIDLMMNDGEEALNWSQNNNETITDTVKIGKGIEVSSDTTNTITRIDSDGSRVLNKTTGEVVREDTDKGTITNQFESRSTSKVNGLLVLKVGNQVWMSGV